MRPDIDFESSTESDRRGFPHGVWLVEDNYTVEDGIVRSTWMAELHAKGRYGPTDFPRVKRIYWPASTADVVGELAKVESGNENGVLDFVNSYGLLGHDELVTPKPGIPNGDPLWWFWRHAETVKMCMELTALLQNKDSAGIKRILGIQKDGFYDFPKIGVRGGWDGEFKARALTDDCCSEARNTRSVIINANIKNISRIIRTNYVTGKVESCFKFSALIEMIYWHLADACVIGLGVRQCAYDRCPGFFIPTDPRQRYCPSRWIENGPSPCARRARVEKWRSNPENRDQERKRNRNRMRQNRKA